MLRGGPSLARLLASKQAPVLLRCHRRRYATALDQLPRPGDKLHGFTVQRAKTVPELELAAIHLCHDKTGAEYIHIAREDRNNVFAAGFKTNPNDDTGVPHILEHTTLCGSEKYVFCYLFYYILCCIMMLYHGGLLDVALIVGDRYPVRDPFFKMLNRSLSYVPD